MVRAYGSQFGQFALRWQKQAKDRQEEERWIEIEDKRRVETELMR